MAFTLWSLFEATLLFLNAVCILHEERFLAKMGWGANANVHGFGEQPTVKSQVLNLIRSIRTVMRTVEGGGRHSVLALSASHTVVVTAGQHRGYAECAYLKNNKPGLPAVFIPATMLCIVRSQYDLPLIFLNVATIVIKLLLG